MLTQRSEAVLSVLPGNGKTLLNVDCVLHVVSCDGKTTFNCELQDLPSNGKTILDDSILVVLLSYSSYFNIILY